MDKLVFVYGTLKRGEPNHHWMTDPAKGRAEFVGNASTAQRFPLVIASRYNIPFLLDLPGRGHSIKGEVYRIDERKLGYLDELEGYPTLYGRRDEKLVMKHKPEMLEMEMLSDYSSNGSHGKKYAEEDDLSDPEDIDIG